MIETALVIIQLILWIIVPIVVFACRNWIVAAITKGIQHNFDRKIETLRAELRASEEKLKSELRLKEAEISTLRANILTGTLGRQTLFDKRRFEAVERIWTTVNDFASLKPLSSMMAILNYKEIAADVGKVNMQQFLSTIGAAAPDIKTIKNIARDERPFVPELAWAYFSAFTTILMGNFLRFQVLKAGLPDATKYLTDEPQKKILKAALPHQAQFIDQYESGTYHYLLDELEERLLAELRKILKGEEIDREAAERAKAILGALSEETKEQGRVTTELEQNI